MMAVTTKLKVFSDVFDFDIRMDGSLVTGTDITRDGELVARIDQSTRARDIDVIARAVSLSAQETGVDIKGGLDVIKQFIEFSVSCVGTENPELADYLKESAEQPRGRPPQERGPHDPFTMVSDNTMVPPSEAFPESCWFIVAPLEVVELEDYCLIRTNDGQTLIRQLQETDSGRGYSIKEDPQWIPETAARVVGKITATMTLTDSRK